MLAALEASDAPKAATPRRRKPMLDFSDDALEKHVTEEQAIARAQAAADEMPPLPGAAPAAEAPRAKATPKRRFKPQLDFADESLEKHVTEEQATARAEAAAEAEPLIPSSSSRRPRPEMELKAVLENETMVTTGMTPCAAGRPGGMFLDCLDADVDLSMSVSSSWIVDKNGSMLHAKTGTKISENTGISVAGREYTLTADQIEVDGGEQLGAGACGQVRKGRLKLTGDFVAIKTIKAEDKPKRKQMLAEVKILIECEKCEYLVHWYGAFLGKQGSSMMVVLEFMDLGSLRDLVNRFPKEGDVKTGMPFRELAGANWQIFTGLDFLHQRDILHRDIKPENILHSKAGYVKLTDFGISKELCDQTAACTFMGTMTYMSPERCEGEAYRGQSDVWSCGLVLYELASGRYPFDNVISFPALFEALMDKPEPRLDETVYDADLCSFTAQCITRDSAKRPSAAELLQHAFATRDVALREDVAAYFATLVGK